MFQIREGKKDFIEMKQTILMDEQELIKKGHNVTERSIYGGLNIIYVENEMMMPVTDPRMYGKAGGF